MRPISFVRALQRALFLIGNAHGTILVSVGSNLSLKASVDAIHAQQIPREILESKHPAAIILVDPTFARVDPVGIDRILSDEGYMVRKGWQVVPLSKTNLTLFKVGAFFDADDYKKDTKLLTEIVRRNPKIDFWIGDFTITGPFVPFDDYLKQLLTNLRPLSHVRWSLEATKEHYGKAPT